MDSGLVRNPAVLKERGSNEEGEVVNDLPYVRISRRHQSEATRKGRMKDPMMSVRPREIAPDRLTATKRIINAYNSGDIEGIRDIIFDSSLDMSEMYFCSMEHVFIGKASLFSLWMSIFEAFPNGIFRTSDSVINEKKQVFTSFLFFGTKIFPLLIDGMPVELCGMNGKGGALETSRVVVQSASVVVDRNQGPLFNTMELLETDDIPEMIFEGRIILQMDEDCMIQTLDFSWSRRT